ncbi:transcription termination/antitermination protein NusG [Candidatus Saccharibacteria bacterium]|nr:transcription termination/antitermination protein NusG [Candidatus Saccharibacteria bacterium]
MIDLQKNWFVVHTYSGYEDQVADALRQRIDSLDMKDKIFDVIVPKEKQIEIKNGKRRTVERKIFPGYIMIEMVVTEESWFVVRNTPNVTGFVGTSTNPSPLSEDEVKSIQRRMGIDEPKYHIDFKIGEVVNITDGPFKGFDGQVSEIDEQKGKIKVLVSMFGRETPVELDSLQVKKI